jgi:hypothetical protein
MIEAHQNIRAYWNVALSRETYLEHLRGGGWHMFGNLDKKRITMFVAAAALIAAALACISGSPQPVGQTQNTGGPATATIEVEPPTHGLTVTPFGFDQSPVKPSITPLSGSDATLTAVTGGSGGPVEQNGPTSEPDHLIRQWAISAIASSQMGDSKYSASQAVGDPGAEGCGDNPRAWAGAGMNTVDTLTLTYAIPVIPTQINIHQTASHSSVTRIDVVDTAGAIHTVFTGQPFDLDTCPYLMQQAVSGISVKINQIIITVDQSVPPAGPLGEKQRNQINAVELLGIP